MSKVKGCGSVTYLSFCWILPNRVLKTLSIPLFSYLLLSKLIFANHTDNTWLLLFEGEEGVGGRVGGTILTTTLSSWQHPQTTTTTCFLTSLLPSSPSEWWSHTLHSINCLHCSLWSLTWTWHPAKAAPCGVLTIIRHFVVERTHNVCTLWITQQAVHHV